MCGQTPKTIVSKKKLDKLWLKQNPFSQTPHAREYLAVAWMPPAAVPRHLQSVASGLGSGGGHSLRQLRSAVQNCLRCFLKYRLALMHLLCELVQSIRQSHHHGLHPNQPVLRVGDNFHGSMLVFCLLDTVLAGFCSVSQGSP